MCFNYCSIIKIVIDTLRIQANFLIQAAFALVFREPYCVSRIFRHFIYILSDIGFTYFFKQLCSTVLSLLILQMKRMRPQRLSNSLGIESKCAKQHLRPNSSFLVPQIQHSVQERQLVRKSRPLNSEENEEFDIYCRIQWTRAQVGSCC